jgi:D-arabinose 1-dehydrogenase-like Zn-dependent alcohol dehydrogenase
VITVNARAMAGPAERFKTVGIQRRDVEMVYADQIDEAFDRVAGGEVRYRFVIDVSTLKEA